MIKKIIFLSAILLSTTVSSKPEVSIDQCAKWYKLVEKYEEASRDGYYVEWNRKKQKEAKRKMMNANCPARHNKYFR